MKLEVYLLPAHWASTLINGDASGLDDAEETALNQLVDDIVAEFGAAYCIDVKDGEGEFTYWHDATPYLGCLGCQCLEFTFDVGA